MPFFRRSSAVRDLACRPFEAADLPVLHELLSQTDWLALTVPRDELALVCADQLSVGLTLKSKLAGAVLASWSITPVAWVRAVVLQQNLAPFEALPPLIHALSAHAQDRGVASLYFMSDAGDVVWLRRHLIDAGYAMCDEVVGYEKRSWLIPDWGNQAVAIRPAVPGDVPLIAATDLTAFEPPWVKDATVLHGVFPIAPCYIVAEWEGTIVGYAFATTHYLGRAAHLVRIAVAPQVQGLGIGVRLLAEVVSWCKQQSIEVLSLNTQLTNVRAQRLYTWFGFVRTGERQMVLNRQLLS